MRSKQLAFQELQFMILVTEDKETANNDGVQKNNKA